MGIKLGDISPLAGAITGKGMFGGLRRIAPAISPAAAVLMKGEQKPDQKMRRGFFSRRGFPDRQAIEEMATKGRKGMGTPGPSGAKDEQAMKKGGKVKKMAKGGSASKRADGCATKGKTKGRFV